MNTISRFSFVPPRDHRFMIFSHPGKENKYWQRGADIYPLPCVLLPLMGFWRMERGEERGETERERERPRETRGGFVAANAQLGQK